MRWNDDVTRSFSLSLFLIKSKRVQRSSHAGNSLVLSDLLSFLPATQTRQECFRKIPPSFPSAADPSSIRTSPPPSLRAPITRRNAHLPRGGGPVMVSDHSKLLSSKGGLSASLDSFLLVTPTPPLLTRIFNPATAISGKALSPGATWDLLGDGSRFLITVMAARRGARVETPIERWKLRR